MGFLWEKITITGTRKTKNLRALLDSGAARNYIRKTLNDNDKVGDLGYRAYLGKQHVTLPDERNIPSIRVIFDNVKIRDSTFWNVEFLVLDTLIHEVILGSNFLQEMGIILDLNEHKIEFKKRE